MEKKIKTEQYTNYPKSATSLMVFGWIIIIGGIIAGIVVAVQVNFYFALISWFVSTLSGLLLIGFGRVISLLTIIANKDYIVISNEKKPDYISPEKAPATAIYENRPTMQRDEIEPETEGKTEFELITCPECKTRQKANRHGCWNCGYPFVEKNE